MTSPRMTWTSLVPPCVSYNGNLMTLISKINSTCGATCHHLNCWQSYQVDLEGKVDRKFRVREFSFEERRNHPKSRRPKAPKSQKLEAWLSIVSINHWMLGDVDCWSTLLREFANSALREICCDVLWNPPTPRAKSFRVPDKSPNHKHWVTTVVTWEPRAEEKGIEPKICSKTELGLEIEDRGVLDRTRPVENGI
jgi:hypothetical protein